MSGPCGGGLGHCRAPRCWIAVLEVLIHADGGRGEGVDHFRVGGLPRATALCPSFRLGGRVPGCYEPGTSAPTLPAGTPVRTSTGRSHVSTMSPTGALSVYLATLAHCYQRPHCFPFDAVPRCRVPIPPCAQRFHEHQPPATLGAQVRFHAHGRIRARVPHEHKNALSI